MEVIIRKATKKDFDELIDLKLKLKKEERAYNKDLGPIKSIARHYRQYLKEDLTKKDRIMLAAVNDNKIIAIITIRIYRSLRIFGYRKRGHLSNLYVTKKARKRGIGQRLVNEAIRWCKSRKIKEVTLEIFEKNVSALNLYNKLGFRNYSVKMIKKI